MKRNFTPQRNTQQQLVEFLINNPFTTEKNICIECWDEIREKKHADLIRRALGSGKINRVRAKIKNKNLFHYYVTSTNTRKQDYKAKNNIFSINKNNGYGLNNMV